MKTAVMLLAAMSILSGCAHVISEETRRTIDPDISPSMVFADPHAYQGRTVLLGGIIISSRNARDGTYIEVMEQSLDRRGRPVPEDQTLGRFIVFHEGFLDTTIYAPQRFLTVAGEITGQTVRTLGEIDYRYVMIRSRELRTIRPGYDTIPIHFGIGLWHTF